MRVVALPEAPHVAANVAGHALGELETGIPAQRAVAKDPHGGVAVARKRSVIAGRAGIAAAAAGAAMCRRRFVAVV